MQTQGPQTTGPNPNGLPVVESSLPPVEVMERARQMSKRGKLPGDVIQPAQCAIRRAHAALRSYVMEGGTAKAVGLSHGWKD